VIACMKTATIPISCLNDIKDDISKADFVKNILQEAER